MVVMRRSSADTNFDRIYDDYENGFGDLKGDFWFGLRSLQDITSKRTYELRLDMYNQSNDTKSQTHAHYSSFEVTSPDYKLMLGNFTGSDPHLMNNLEQFNEQPFSAKKTNLDASNSCCITFIAGWWFTEVSCLSSRGGTPGSILTQSYHQLSWYDTANDNYPITNTRTFNKYELKIRPTDCSTAGRNGT